MRLIATAVLAAVMLAGCATNGAAPISGAKWVVTEKNDAFTDDVTRMLTFGDIQTSSGIITKSMRYYPFVGSHNGELFIGLRSGGRYTVPTGTVQIRVDAHEAWTITPDDTPLYLVPPAPAAPAAAPLPENLSAQVKQVQAQAMQSVARSMSPFTAVTGERARGLLAQMLEGKRIIFRTVGMNQAASTTGLAEIDASFIDGVKSLGLR